MGKPNTIKIDEVEYIRADLSEQAPSVDGMTVAIVRTYSAGVFAGYIKERNGKEVTLINSRRLWYWEGACSLSQLAVDGVSKPDQCKFPCVVPETYVTEAIEIIPMTAKAWKSISEVPVWKK